MGHMISENDKQQGLEMAWHNLTEVLPEISLADSWLAQTDVRKETLYTGDMQPTEFCQIVATDKPSIRIGQPVHKDSYQLITNADFLRIIGDALQNIKGAKVASVGSVCNRARVFVSVQLSEVPEFTAAGRKHNAFLNFLNSHDQSAPFTANSSMICTVCNNTFGMNLIKGFTGLKAAEERAKMGVLGIKLKHTKNVAAKLENVPELIDGFLGAQALFKAKLDAMKKQRIEAHKARHLFAGFIGADAKGEMGTRKENQVNRLQELFHTGKGNRGEDMADAFNAVTDYYTHESSGESDDKMRQIVSSEYGSGQTAKARAFDLFGDRESVKDLINKGEKLLAVA